MSLAAPGVIFSQTGLHCVARPPINPVPSFVGAQVTVSNESVSFQDRRITDSSGHYEFPQIAPGDNTITAKATAFKAIQAT